MVDYKTVLTTHETESDVKKSRFISMVFHVEDEIAVETILTLVRKKHYKATHVCWAYVLNSSPKRQKASDDGEPSGTAGKPILDMINHRELSDVLVVVIRYFGGVKLGTGGLIRAYGGGAGEVLNASQITKKQFSDQLRIMVSYSGYGNLMSGLSEKEILAVHEEFGEKVTLSFFIPVAETPAFLAWVLDQTNANSEVTMGDQTYVDVVESLDK